MIPRFIDWIWHIRGSLTLAPGQSEDDAFRHLNPLFQEPGTSYEQVKDTLTFRKKGQRAQDKMSVFDNGILQISREADRTVLRYHMVSKTLLYCFLAPLLFLTFAGATIAINKYNKSSTEATEKAKKDNKETKKEEKLLPQNPIDKALGAPAPDKPKKDKKKEDEGKLSPTPAYVFAGIFVVLYIAGRILEAMLIKRLFKRHLPDST